MDPRVTLVGWTHFQAPEGVPWSTDAEGGQALAEFAGRACYETWDKPNPATDTNATFLAHLIEVGHLAVLEHAVATFYLTGVSRGLTHELVRHRHLSFSELSPRYPGPGVVEPAAIRDDPELHAIFTEARARSDRAYGHLMDRLEGKVGRTRARQAARAVLPTAAESRIVVTGNCRAWRHFVAVRGSEPADVELRGLAVAVLRELQRVAPHIFSDFAISTLADGSEVAASPWAPPS